jgi:L-asparaginase type I
MAERTVHILNTGGTISYAAGGAGLTFQPETMLTEVETSGHVVYREVLRKGSVEMTPGDWATIAGAVDDALRQGTDGVVILHGTDTMAFTAAALSFMLANLPVPVVLTGSMRPGGAADSDAPRNLQNALTVAARADLGEVAIVFSAAETGPDGVILRGNRARKISSTALRAFASPNHPPLGSVADRKVRLTEAAIRRGKRGVPALARGLDPNVALLRYHPGCTAASLGKVLADVDGAVIEGTGLGHLPTQSGLLEVIRASAKPVVLVSACWEGGVRLGLYDIDRKVREVENIVPGDDLTPEAALVKLMWVLGREQQLDRVKVRMQEPVAGELTPTEVG